jgi:hypothetical protein
MASFTKSIKQYTISLMLPTIDIQLFLINGLAIHLYSARESVEDNHLRVKNAHLYVPGLPQMTDKRFFQKIVDKDNSFFYVYYYGSWLSGGVFSPDNCRKSIIDALEIIKSGSAVKSFDGKEFSWEFESLSILGCSFAGNSVLSSELDGSAVQDVVLYSPLIFVNTDERAQYMTDEESIQFDRYNKDFLFFMRNGYPNALRGIEDPSWDDYFYGNDDLSKVSLDDNDNLPKFILYHGLNDKIVSPRSTEHLAHLFPSRVKAELIPGFGHDFISLYNHINEIK